MILISHRGNIFGPIKSKENNPLYIQNAIDFGYDCEVDVYFIDSCLYLGHDRPEYNIELDWLYSRKSRLWVHCKNLLSLSYFNSTDFNYFWHENDKATLTSKGFIWAYPGMQPIKNSIAVMPEIYGDVIQFSLGICSDYVNKYAK